MIRNRERKVLRRLGKERGTSETNSNIKEPPASTIIIRSSIDQIRFLSGTFFESFLACTGISEVACTGIFEVTCHPSSIPVHLSSRCIPLNPEPCLDLFEFFQRNYSRIGENMPLRPRSLPDHLGTLPAPNATLARSTPSHARD